MPYSDPLKSSPKDQGAPPASKSSSRLLGSLRDWHIGMGAAVLAAVISLIPRIFSPTFYYWDDMMQSFLPMWRHLGEEMRQGNFPLMEPDGWVGGNVIAEVGYGIFNPINIANSYIVSFIPSLSWASYFIIVQFIGLLAFSVYMLARGYGAIRSLALAAAIAVPFMGFTLFYEAARWPGGLMAFAWVTLFWWSMRRYIHRGTSPFLPFMAGFLTMTAGNPYGAIGVILVLVAILVEVILVRHWKRILPLAIIGVLIGLTAVLVYFPLPLSSSVTVRTSVLVTNDLFLQPDMADLFSSSTSALRPRLTNFWSNIDVVPATYLAWFALPLVPWLDFQAIKHRSRNIISIYVLTAAYFILTFMPSNVLVFRWPVRLIEYLYLGVIIILVVMASAGIRTTFWRKRLLFTLLILVFGTYRAWSIFPEALKPQLLSFGVTVALVAFALVLWRRWKMSGLAIAMISGTILTLFLQSFLYIPGNVVAEKGSPTDLKALEFSTQEYKGNTLQLYSVKKLSSEDFISGKILYGNQILNAGVDNSMGRYSGISFTTYAAALCMNYRGETCPAAYSRLFEPASSSIHAPLADVLNVETLVVQKKLIPTAQLRIPSGWSLVSSDSVRNILRRDAPLPYPGTVSWTSTKTQVTSSSQKGNSERVALESSDEPGSLTFSRLAWPGYSVSVDGKSQPLEQGPAGIIEVRLPAGAKEVQLDFQPPGFVLGIAAQGVSWFGIIMATILYYVRKRDIGKK